jgi:hypothetical protein
MDAQSTFIPIFQSTIYGLKLQRLVLASTQDRASSLDVRKLCGIYTMASPSDPPKKVVNVSSGPDTEKTGLPVFVMVSLNAWMVSKYLL